MDFLDFLKLPSVFEDDFCKAEIFGEDDGKASVLGVEDCKVNDEHGVSTIDNDGDDDIIVKGFISLENLFQ